MNKIKNDSVFFFQFLFIFVVETFTFRLKEHSLTRFSLVSVSPVLSRPSPGSGQPPLAPGAPRTPGANVALPTVLAVGAGDAGRAGEA